MNQSKKGASLTTTPLSPLAKPFTLNRSNHQPSSNLSAQSAQEPSVYSSDHCNYDPFGSLLDSFRKHNLGAKGASVVSVPLGDYGFGQETATATVTLPVETATQTQEKSLCRQHLSMEFQKNSDFDGLSGSDFNTLDEFSLPTYSPNITDLGYGTSTVNELSYGKQGADFHESLVGKGNDVGSSAADGSMLQKGSDGIFKKSTATIVSKDILYNSKGTIHASVESSSFLMSNSEVTPLMLSTSDMSSATKLKNTPQNQSSKNLDDGDSDVDSPCWKGTMAFCLSPPEISGSVQSQHVEKALDKHNSLNPLAPQFFPSSGYVKDDFVSSKSSAPEAINLLSGEDILMKPVMAEPHPVELNKGVMLQHSSNIYGREKAINMLNDPKSSSVDPVLNSSYMMTQSSIKDCSTSKGKLVTIVDVGGCVKGTKDLRASGSISGSVPAKGHSLTPTSTTSSSRVGVVADLFKTLQGVSKSLIESPILDVQIMVNAMHVLSELLVQTCAGGVDSYNEHDHDKIQQIINNLNVFSPKECGQRMPTLYSTHTDSPYCLDGSSELPKGLEVTSIETLAVPHRLYPHNDFMGQNRVSKVVANRGRNSFASSSDQGIEEGNDIVQLQVIRRSLGKSLDVEKQIHPEALLFRNLWLDSEAERCFRRYKTYLWLMKAGMDVNCTNVAELWR